MPREGWSTVQVPDGWIQSIRGPRPHSVKWPMKGPGQKKPNGPAPVKSRRTSQVTHPPPAAGQRGPTPEEVISNARARVSKLEAAMAAVGKSDPTFSALQEALKKTQGQAPARPVEEVSRAQEALAQAQTKLQSEEQGLVDGEARLAALIQQSASVEEPPPTAPANFAHELAELRACVQALQRDNHDLRSQLQSTEGPDADERHRKQPKNLSCSTLD